MGADRMKPRLPRHIIARGAVAVTIANGRVVVCDEHGLILTLHDARVVILNEQEDQSLFGFPDFELHPN